MWKCGSTVLPATASVVVESLGLCLGMTYMWRYLTLLGYSFHFFVLSVIADDVLII